MKRRVHIILFLLFAFFTMENLQAQGVSRAQGVGFRMNFWNITGGRTSIMLEGKQCRHEFFMSGENLLEHFDKSSPKSNDKFNIEVSVGSTVQKQFQF